MLPCSSCAHILGVQRQYQSLFWLERERENQNLIIYCCIEFTSIALHLREALALLLYSIVNYYFTLASFPSSRNIGNYFYCKT